jgi:hypothetical protein
MYQYESMERERDSDKETNNDHSEIDDSFFVFLVPVLFRALSSLTALTCTTVTDMVITKLKGAGAIFLLHVHPTLGGGHAF